MTRAQLGQEMEQAWAAASEEVVTWLRRLVACQTVNPPGNEQTAAAVLKEFLDAAGIPCQTYEAEPGRTNLIAAVGSGSPRLVVACHLDVVPPGDGWRTPPFELARQDDNLFGRGVVDNKGPLVPMMILARLLKRREREMKGTLLLVGAADEERGSRLGLEFLVKAGHLRADHAIIPDIGYNLERISIAEKGLIKVAIRSRGKSAHGATPEKGVNAIWKLLDFLNKLRDYRIPAESHPLFTPPSLNLGVVRGGEATNMVPSLAEAQIDIRFLPGMDPKKIVAGLEALLRETAAHDPEARLECEMLEVYEPTQLPGDDPLIALIQAKARAVANKETRLTGLSGITVTKQLLPAGVMAVGFSPGGAEVAHIANEWVSLAELVSFGRIMSAIALDYFSLGEGTA